MQHSLEAIQAFTGAVAKRQVPAAIVSEILYDSRRLRGTEGVLFVAISGRQHNGHDYIPELVEKGVRHFLVEYIPEGVQDRADFLIVENSLRAFQQMAEKIRLHSPAKTIGITGSNGKTIVKEWLARLLKTEFSIAKSPKSYNSQLGVPLSVCKLTPADAFGVFEAGISKPGEMQALAQIIRPALGIFTNIGSAHQENFESLAQKINEKLKLFTDVKQLVYCADHEPIDRAVRAQLKKAELWSWSYTEGKARVWVAKKDRHYQLHHEDESHAFHLPFEDQASVENALHVATALLALGLSPKVFYPKLAGLEQLSMRLEMKKGRAGTLLLNDAYSNDLESLKMALEYFVQQTATREKVLILSDIEQSGHTPEALNKVLEKLLKNYPLDELIVVGRGVVKLDGKLPYPTRAFESTRQLLRRLPLDALAGKAVLLKGARSFAFEEVDRWLEEKSHETVLEVNLAHMVENLNVYRSRLKSGVKTMVMLKAFGYGAGAYELASLLQFHKVDYLAVAYADEGVALRKAGIALPILVLNTEISSLGDLLDYKLEPEVYSFRVLFALKEKVQHEGRETPLKIHVKIETGMHRLGFEANELSALVEALKDTPLLRVNSVFSHLAAADEPDERAFSLGQITRFEEGCAQLREGLGYAFDRHILNSSGIYHFPEAQFDMVRLGLGLYGLSADPAEAAYLKPISSLKATVSQLKVLKKGESLGYGRAYIAPEDQTIATISLGYADGFRRSLGNGVGEVAIRGRLYPVVGRVCMDMTMVNVTGGVVAEGDEAEVFGPHLSLYTLAKKMDTIPYEVLTGIPERVKRVYLME